jgi:hypothetical protein
MEPQMNARQQRHVGALGNTLGETQVRGSPRLTSAAPDGGELRRPMLTRQKQEGQHRTILPKVLLPPQAASKSTCLPPLSDTKVLATLTIRPT